MKNSHNGPGMETYCPGLIGSVGLRLLSVASVLIVGYDVAASCIQLANDCHNSTCRLFTR